VLAGRGVHIPRAKKTGTTIVGVVFDGGVVLGADTRATEGDTVADKNCEKIHYIHVRAPATATPVAALASPPAALSGALGCALRAC
jgi:20S proteasome alpha/beta subunit